MSPHLWRPVQAGGRVPFVVCIICRARELNETNRLRRGGWQETTGGQRVFRCGACSEAPRFSERCSPTGCRPRVSPTNPGDPR